MTRQHKEEVVAFLTDEFKEAKAILVCGFSGLTVQEIETARALANEADTKVHVVKNTLASIALNNAGLEPLELKEANILVWGDDQISVCKVADKAATDFKEKFVIKSGLFEGEKADLSQIAAIAKLPSKEELIGMLLSVWTAPVRNFVTGLDNLKTKREEESA
ncbi:MAG TPA: 50S ribosomal protein L10 [Campylobacteraceae bacterium]|jgi:large subunit ribosomal protein L10|nr:50S ribosomal protein L10 [Campylobacteraceae bacterium]